MDINEKLGNQDYGAGFVKDDVSETVILFFIKIYRDTFQECEYLIPKESPKELNECLEAMKKVIKDKAIVSIKLLTYEDIIAPLNLIEVTEPYRRFGAMSLCALTQAFEDYMRKRSKKEQYVNNYSI